MKKYYVCSFFSALPLFSYPHPPPPNRRCLVPASSYPLAHLLPAHVLVSLPSAARPPCPATCFLCLPILSSCLLPLPAYQTVPSSCLLRASAVKYFAAPSFTCHLIYYFLAKKQLLLEQTYKYVMLLTQPTAA